jgi:hypothetical protein
VKSSALTVGLPNDMRLTRGGRVTQILLVTMSRGRRRVQPRVSRLLRGATGLAQAGDLLSDHLEVDSFFEQHLRCGRVRFAKHA